MTTTTTTTLADDQIDYTYDDQTPCVKITQTLALKAIEPNTSAKFGALIGTVDYFGKLDGESTVAQFIDGESNYYLYYASKTANTVVKGCGGVSESPNGTASSIELTSQPSQISNTIKVNTREINFTQNNITTVSSYYRSIFSSGEWANYFDIQSLNQNAPYPDLLFII